MEDKTKKSKESKTANTGLIIRIMWKAFFAGIILIVVLFSLISFGVIGYTPNIAELSNPIDKYASQVYSSDNQLLGTFSQSKENRIQSNYDELSPFLVKALVATEDSRFYSHSGIDFQALGRVAIKTIFLFHKSSGGGSTITQQLAKQLFSPHADNFFERSLQKPIEWVIAAKLERCYTKDEIINLYLNKFDFLNNAVGIQSAAKVYFNKSPKDLKIEEAAMLIGMCKNPSIFNPRRFPDKAKGRRNVVLDQMYKANYITKSERDSLQNLPLTINFRRVDHKDGLAPYFREYLRLTMTAHKPQRSKYASWQTEQYERDSVEWVTDPLYGWCYKNKKADGSYYNLYSDGLRIYTTIDSRMQNYAEESVSEHVGGYLQPAFSREKRGRSYAPYSRTVAGKVNDLLKNAMKLSDRYRAMHASGMSDQDIYAEFKKPIEMKVFSWRGEIDTTMTPLDSIRYMKGFLHAGFIALNPSNGYVKAYVGGVDFKYFQYDMVNLGRRQVGSTIKPYLYTLAMEEGMTPCDEMMHVQQVLTTEGGRQWAPRNDNHAHLGEMVSIKWGLQNSDNWVTAYLMGRTSPYALVRLLHSFGITGHIDPVVSLALGTCDVSVAEMAGAYTAFANKGIKASPIYVTRIEDAYGNEVATFTPQMKEIFSELTSVKMLEMLRAVIDGGTGSRVRSYGLRAQMGGKTGTTQNNSDGWFMGFTPRLVTGCWVGGDDRSIHFDGMTYGQGAAMALPIYARFMKKVYADPVLGYSQDEKFPLVTGNPDPCANTDGGDVVDSTQVSQKGIDDLFNQ